MKTKWAASPITIARVVLGALVVLAAPGAPAMAQIAQVHVTGGEIANPGPAPFPNLDRLKTLDIYYAWRGKDSPSGK